MFIKDKEKEFVCTSILEKWYILASVTTSFIKVTKPILRSGDFNTCLICYIETKERERVNKKKKRKCMYQMTTITDYIAHSIISLNKKNKERKRRFVYFFSMSDTTTNYDCIVTIVHVSTHSLTPSSPPSSSKHWISRARAQ